MLGRIPPQITDPDRQAIPHPNNTQLTDGILVEELFDEVFDVAEGEEVSSGAEVFFEGGGGEVDEEDEVADDAALEGGGVFEESGWETKGG